MAGAGSAAPPAAAQRRRRRAPWQGRGQRVGWAAASAGVGHAKKGAGSVRAAAAAGRPDELQRSSRAAGAAHAHQGCSCSYCSSTPAALRPGLPGVLGPLGVPCPPSSALRFAPALPGPMLGRGGMAGGSGAAMAACFSGGWCAPWTGPWTARRRGCCPSPAALFQSASLLSISLW